MIKTMKNLLLVGLVVAGLGAIVVPSGTAYADAADDYCKKYSGSLATICEDAFRTPDDANCAGFSRGGSDRVNACEDGAKAGAAATSGGDETEGEGADQVVCSAGALGWVLCPFMAIMADTTEYVAEVLGGYLAFNPFAGENNTIRTIWGNILNVANILLAVAFLVVVFSQSTSIGLSNYGIKRMLPRIIAAAILMNLSYFICQILVDISNIAGVGVTSLVTATTGTTFAESVAEVGFGAEVLAATGVIAFVLFFFLIPALLAFLAVLLTIAARNAIIILLVIIAPLAFAAWILPNTEKYFKKWWELLISMLVLYPLMMFVFAASIVAANTINSVQPSDATGTQSLNAIISLLVLSLPLLALPFMFKTASGLLARVNDMTRQKLRSGMDKGDGLRKKYKESDFGKYRRDRVTRRAQQELLGNKQSGAWRSPSLIKARGQRALYGSAVAGGYGAYKTDVLQNEAREQQDKMKQEFGRISPFAAQAFVDAGGDSRRFSNEINKRLADGQLNENDIASLRRIEHQGLLTSGTAMAGAVGSLASSGFLTEDHVRNAETAINKQFGEKSDAGKIALDRLSDTINSGAKDSGMAQHMRWGTVGGELLQNGQDFSSEQAYGKLSNADKARYASLSNIAAGKVPNTTERQQTDAASEAASLLVKGQKQLKTQLGFQKLASAAAISRKSFEGPLIPGESLNEGTRAFRQTMAEKIAFNDDVVLTAAGVKGQMNAQDRAKLRQEAENYFGTLTGADAKSFESALDEAKARGGYNSGGATRTGTP